jgi:hypothetical protein
MPKPATTAQEPAATRVIATIIRADSDLNTCIVSPGRLIAAIISLLLIDIFSERPVNYTRVASKSDEVTSRDAA